MPCLDVGTDVGTNQNDAQADSPVTLYLSINAECCICAAFSPQGNARRGVDAHGHVTHVMAERNPSDEAEQSRQRAADKNRAQAHLKCSGNRAEPVSPKIQIENGIQQQNDAGGAGGAVLAGRLALVLPAEPAVFAGPWTSAVGNGTTWFYSQRSSKRVAGGEK